MTKLQHITVIQSAGYIIKMDLEATCTVIKTVSCSFLFVLHKPKPSNLGNLERRATQFTVKLAVQVTSMQQSYQQNSKVFHQHPTETICGSGDQGDLCQLTKLSNINAKKYKHATHSSLCPSFPAAHSLLTQQK